MSHCWVRVSFKDDFPWCVILRITSEEVASAHNEKRFLSGNANDACINNACIGEPIKIATMDYESVIS